MRAFGHAAAMTLSVSKVLTKARELRREEVGTLEIARGLRGRRDIHVVLVQKLAHVAPFAEALEPVLAHIPDARALVFIGAGVAERAVAFLEGFAKGPVGRDAEAVFALEKVGESEVVI